MGATKVVFVLCICFVTGTVLSDTSLGIQGESAILKDIKEQILRLQRENVALLSKVVQLEETTHRLDHENKKLRERIQVLENAAISTDGNVKIPPRTYHNETSSANLIKPGIKRTNAQSHIRKSTGRNVSIKEFAIKPEIRRNQLLTPKTSVVAFFATIGQSHLQVPHNGSTIIFENVVTNFGNAYHPFHGNFVAYIPGIYEFSFTIGITTASDDDLTYVALLRNGVIVAQIFGKAVDIAGHTVILQLNQGDDIYLVFWGNVVNYLRGDHYSSFSGHLLSKIE